MPRRPVSLNRICFGSEGNPERKTPSNWMLAGLEVRAGLSESNPIFPQRHSAKL